MLAPLVPNSARLSVMRGARSSTLSRLRLAVRARPLNTNRSHRTSLPPPTYFLGCRSEPRGFATVASPATPSTSSSSLPRVQPLEAGPVGEWAFRASVLGTENAMSGFLFLDETGRALYLADGVQVVGRGVGQWVQVGSTTAVELQVYQYGAAETTVPEGPHTFRGIWERAPGQEDQTVSGSWYFCPDAGEPMLVGSFDTAASASILASSPAPSSPPAASPGGLPWARPTSLSPAETASAMAALDDAVAKSRSIADREDLLEKYRVGNIAKVHYVPEWISEEQEKAFLLAADRDQFQWEDMRTRHSQEWGAGDRCGCGRGLRREPLPTEHQAVADALHTLRVFDGALYPMNSVRINAYQPGQGIYPHCDGPVYYPKIAILSLASHCLLHLYPRKGNEDNMKWDAQNNVPSGHVDSAPLATFLLEPRSLILLSQDAFWHHRHGIEAVVSEKIPPTTCNLELTSGQYNIGDELKRERRVSFTMRHLLPRCACQG